MFTPGIVGAAEEKKIKLVNYRIGVVVISIGVRR